MLVGDDFFGDVLQFICIDETSKNECTYAWQYGWAFSGEQAELKDVFVHGGQYSLVAVLSVEGYIAVEVVPGSFDSIDFLEFIQEQVVGSSSCSESCYQLLRFIVNPFPNEWSVLVLDKCCIHHNEALSELVHAAGYLLLYPPAYSLDLNPIEESFSLTCMWNA